MLSLSGIGLELIFIAAYETEDRLIILVSDYVHLSY